MKPVVTEQTSKRYKGLMLLGGVLCCVGVVSMIGSESPGFGLGSTVVGLGLYAFGRFSAWWNHG